MQRIENADVRLSRGIENLHHMRNALVGFSNTLQAIPYFAALGNKIVVRIHHEKCGDLLIKLQICQVVSSYGFTNRSLCAGNAPFPSLMLFGRILFRNDKCDQACVEGAVVRILQFNEHFVRTRGKTHQDDGLTTRIRPHP
jgi:hypothetical protein